MEPNKLEAEFRTKLNQREIIPSSNAWEKLDRMLANAEKPKHKFPWLFIAASFAGFLLIGTVYFRLNENVIGYQKNEIVIQNSVAPKTTLIPVESIKLESENEKGIVTNVVHKLSSGINKTPLLIEKSIAVNNNSSQNQVAEVSINNQITEQKLIKLQTSELTITERLAVATSSLKKENQSIQNPVVRVYATNLLSQVDGELELSFREKVIDKVSKNFQTVKVALTNRNLE
jgi:hypothetical protein